MEDQVPDDVVKDRFDRLFKKRCKEISAEVCSVHQGTTQDVLVESVNDHDPSLKEAKGFYYMGELCK